VPDSALLIDALRLFAAAYLIVLAGAACVGKHSELLSYPPRVAYASVRLLVLVGTLGRVRMAPVARRARRSSRRSLSHVRDSLRRGGETTESISAASWSSSHQTQTQTRDGGAPQPADAPPAAPAVAPPAPPAVAPPPPDRTGLLADDEDDDSPPPSFF
jgi:hypothetical protein